MQRWILRSSAKNMTREISGQVRKKLGADRSEPKDVWGTATTEPPRGDLGEAPECAWCPICRAARRIRESGPGLGSQIAGAGDAVAAAVQEALGAFDTVLSRQGSAPGTDRPRRGTPAPEATAPEASSPAAPAPAARTSGCVYPAARATCKRFYPCVSTRQLRLRQLRLRSSGSGSAESYCAELGGPESRCAELGGTGRGRTWSRRTASRRTRNGGDGGECDGFRSFGTRCFGACRGRPR